ncbi:uncharacterized protein LOC116160599 [Photinus pyralis]|uniref:uncharacterized protein LOC116160599 n=1 Tax=Photinus pyralis TaxID=7054 RepID=UPI0012672BA2|nr:uncharacterized protein LOC116160599 [Photinus pyralis]
MSRKPILSLATIFTYFEEKRTIQKAENALNSGNVQKVQFMQEISTVKGEVLASMKKQVYKVELIITKDGIESSTCTCPRGLYLCHHMAAVALFVHYNISITDTACSWVKSAQESTNKTVTDLFPKPSTSRDYVAVAEEISDQAVQTLYEDLKLCGPTGMGWLLAPSPEEDTDNVVASIEDMKSYT